MLNQLQELTPPALMILAPLSGPMDNMSQGAPPPKVRHRHGPRMASTLFTPASKRDDLIAAYPELKEVCDQLKFGSDSSIVYWCTSPEWALLHLARAAKPPPSSPACDWSQAVLFELIDELVDHHHRPMRNELQRLDILMFSIVHRHVDASVVAFERSFIRLKDHLVAHLDMEETGVFPQCLAIEEAIRSGPGANHGRIDVTSGIRAMKIGHDEASGAFASVLEHCSSCIQEIADPDLELIRSGLLAMQVDHAVHAAMESDILVPAAIFAEDQLRARSASPASAPGPSPVAAEGAPHVR